MCTPEGERMAKRAAEQLTQTAASSGAADATVALDKASAGAGGVVTDTAQSVRDVSRGRAIPRPPSHLRAASLPRPQTVAAAGAGASASGAGAGVAARLTHRSTVGVAQLAGVPRSAHESTASTVRQRSSGGAGAGGAVRSGVRQTAPSAGGGESLRRTHSLTQIRKPFI